MDAEAAKLRWNNVKELFHEALRRDAADRDSFLDGSCSGDPHLRIEVESLLISFHEAEAFLETPAIISRSERKESWQFSKDETISHYRIVEPIGAGGMAEVYLAEDEKLNRQVALKVLPSDVLEDADRLRRFKREALAVSALNHPNILTIFEFDTVNGINLLASEYVKGKTLREKLSQCSLEVGDAMDMAIQIASALETAHKAGVVHRDIKPENIMIRDDGYVKVLDFGLAKLTGDLRDRETDSLHAQAFSLPGMIMGTMTYMSPEQAKSSPIDARSDIFSCGIVLFEMLTGRVPFDGDTNADIIAAILQREPSKASVHNKAVPDELDRIINKCLEKDRSDRYQTAAELLVDLRTFFNPGDDQHARRGARIESMLEKEDPVDLLLQPSDPHKPRAKHSFGIAALVTIFILGIVAVAYWYFSR